MKYTLHLLFACSILFISITFSTLSFAQAPQKFNYQGIARDTKGNVMAHQLLSLKLTILPTSDASESEYEETQLVTTNEFGLYTLQIGNGTPITGDMKTVKWETGNKYIRVAIDTKGGTNFIVAGTTQLLSVPYAIYADKAGISRETLMETNTNNHTRATNNFIEKTSSTGIVNSTSQIFDNGSGVAIGFETPIYTFESRKNSNTDWCIRTTNTAGTSRSAFRIQNEDSTLGQIDITKFGKNFGGTFMGISRNNMAGINSLTGPFVLNCGGDMIFGNSLTVSPFTQTPRMTINGTTGNVGFGLPLGGIAAARVEVNGQIKINGGSPGVGKVLTSDANGLATWQTLVGGSTFTPGAGIDITGNQISNTGDLSNTNEIQSLSLVGNTLSLTSGGSVTLPSDAVTSVNGATGAITQSIALGGVGTSPNVVGSGTNNVIVNLPNASTVNTGVLTSTDYNTFTNKLSGSLSTNRIPKSTGLTTLGQSMLFDNGTSLGVNTITPDASALVHMSSNSKGILIPQVSIDSLKDVTSIPSPTQGLLVYNTTQPGILNDMSRGYYYYSTNLNSWVKLADNAMDNVWQQGGTLGVKLRDTADGVEMMDNYLGSSINFSPKAKILKLLDSTLMNSKNNINALVLTGVNRKLSAGWESRQKTSLLFEMGYQSSTLASATNRVAISGYTENTGTAATNFANGLAFYTFATPENTAVLDTPSFSMFRHNASIGAYAVDVNTVTEGRLQITGFSNGDQLSLRHPSNSVLKWGLYVSSIDSSLNFYANGSLRANIDRVTGVYTALSDRRLKKDIVELSPVLSKLKNLKAYNYRYLDSKETDRKVNGFMAQDLLNDFPELVYQRYDRTLDKPIYTVDYSGFGVLAVKAIQEQQQIIDEQQVQIDNLQKLNSKIENLENQNQLLMKRLEALEKK